MVISSLKIPYILNTASDTRNDNPTYNEKYSPSIHNDSGMILKVEKEISTIGTNMNDSILNTLDTLGISSLFLQIKLNKMNIP